jgi:oligopeptidase B
MLTNKYDTYDKSLKKIHINNTKITGYLEYTKIKPDETNIVPVNEDTQIDIYSETLKQNSLLLPLISDLIKVEDNINILKFEVFKNFVVVLEEVEKKRQFKVYNTLNGTHYIHQPSYEDMYIDLVDNFSFESSYFRYISSSPTIPVITTDYSMGTRKQYDVHQIQFKKYDPSRYKTETIYVTDRNNETKIPVILSYREDLYNTESPYILYTKGSKADKTDLEFNDMRVKLLDRGFVFAIPQVRGTRYFDFDWYSQGIADNKIKHFTDFMDVAYFLIDNEITNRLILYGDEYSGSITTAIALIQNPEIFSLQVMHNPAFDIFDLCMNSAKNIDLIEEFGDIKNRQFYEIMKLYSPYHSKLPDIHSPLLITCDENDKNKIQAMKFTAKLRKKNKLSKSNNHIIFNSFPEDSTIEEKTSLIYSFIIGKTLL